MDLSRYRHGKTKTRAYTSWYSMVKRCTNPQYKYWDDYGGRGILVCDSWLDFRNFYADMGDAPLGHEIDRINNDDGYYKGNCRWVTRTQNARNKRNNVFFEFNGEKLTIMAISEKTGVSSRVIQRRIYAGWPLDVAISSPVDGKPHKKFTRQRGKNDHHNLTRPPPVPHRDPSPYEVQRQGNTAAD